MSLTTVSPLLSPSPRADPVSAGRSAARRAALAAHPAAGVVPRTAAPERVARLAHQLAGPALDWAAHRKPAGREWCRLEAGPEATAYAIAWPPGTGVGFHDHGGAAGALAVVAGALTETMVRPVPGRPLWTCTRTIESGEHATFGARHVHRVHNSGTDLAVSVHVYAPALRTMTYFAPPGPSGLAALRTERL